MDTGKAFDLNNPPLSVSNPGGSADKEYPKHLKRADGTYLPVANAEAEAVARADGWYLTIADALKAATAPVVASIEADVPKRGPGRPRADAAA